MPHRTGSPPAGTSDCIEKCQACHAVCLEAVAHCLGEGAQHARADHIRLLLDCADICRTTADFMLRRSDLHRTTCATCAEICERCAEDCEGFGDDAVMRRCAEACRRAAASCHVMAGDRRAGAARVA